tara:strand:- start:271 stop:459 length:189 start_codon:yes stop_codon:yes gene_type:complete
LKSLFSESQRQNETEEKIAEIKRRWNYQIKLYQLKHGELSRKQKLHIVKRMMREIEEARKHG